MIKKLRPVGNSQALIIEKTLIEALGIQNDTPLQLTISGNSLVITPVNVGFGKDRLDEMVKELRPEYGDMLKKLAE